MRYFKHLLLLLALAISSFSQAQDIPARPEPVALVNDLANVLTQQETTALESKLLNFYANTGNQITLVTVNSLNGSDASSFAYEIGEKWQVGKKGFDNGIVILFKPKTNESKGQVFIATGYGLEGAIPDATSKEIVSNEMIPYFKQGQIYEGINQATSVLMGLAKGEFNHQQYAKQLSSSKSGTFGFLIPLFIILIFSFIGRSKSRGQRTMGSSRSSLPFWLLMGMMGSGSRHGSSFNDFSSGSGGFGGGGSSFGDFGGFGGGSFGGGGAGGSW